MANKECTLQAFAPRKSVVQVRFFDRGTTLAYFNDQFDLHRGDIVFVDGKLEGARGRVIDVNYNFKIKVSEYKRVIAVADTSVKGRFHMAGSHFVTFDPDALPISKILSWYMPPVKEDDEYASGSDDAGFSLDDFKGFEASGAIMDRGYNYYMDNKVVYICIDGGRGYAIVEGSRPYALEFNYDDGKISALVCSCFCGYNCKHQVAAMYQLRETLELIGQHCADRYEQGGYFAAVSKSALFAFAIDGKETGDFVL